MYLIISFAKSLWIDWLIVCTDIKGYSSVISHMTFEISLQGNYLLMLLFPEWKLHPKGYDEMQSIAHILLSRLF